MSADVAALLAAEGFAAPELSLERCRVGGNNRVFVVRAGERAFVAKWYFSHPGDRRDRLHAENSFIHYAMRAGIRAAPRPVSCNREKNLAVYEFIPGRQLAAGEVQVDEVRQAARFFEALNTPTARTFAAGLPTASEACFSLSDHLRMVDQRVARLQSIEARTEDDGDAIEFAVRLTESWKRLRERLEREASRAGEDPDRPLDIELRCVSPSDFGFHNAILRPTGELCFIDFEYAGWDDPAKTVGDFFSQPAVPVPEQFFNEFVVAVTRFAPEPVMLAQRASRMLPLFQIKWCCIMLNVFLPVSRDRRRFADPGLDEGLAKRDRLRAAQAFHCRIRL